MFPIKTIEAFWMRVTFGPHCWKWKGRTWRGYGKHFIGSGKECRSHRFSYAINIGFIPKGLHVLHKCDRRNCVRPSHLWLGTNRDNMIDKKAKGRAPSGEKHYKSKLTWGKVRHIRKLFSMGTWTQSAIAKLYSINPSNVSVIVRNRIWIEK